MISVSNVACSRAMIRCLASAIVLVSPGATAVVAQIPFPSGVQVDRFEYDGLRLLLKKKRLRTISRRFNTAMRRPKESVLVILGDTESLHAMGSRIYTFYKQGGAILVANDQTDHKFLFDFRTFLNKSDSSYLPSDSLAPFDDCPIVRDLDAEHRLFRGVTSIVANRSGFLSFRDADSQSYSRAWLPANHAGHSESFLAIRNDSGHQGRLLVVADHSVFTNQMLIHGSNVTFADNVVNWLCAGGTRRRLVFVRDGKVMPEYSIGNALPPISADELLDSMAEILPKARPNLFDSSFREFTNNAIASMQANDVFNYALRDRTRVRPDLFRRAFVVVATVLLVSMFLVKMVTARGRFQLFRPRLTTNGREHGPTARLLIRDFFVSDNLTDRPAGSKPVAVAKNWWTRRKLQRRMHRLWRRATTSNQNRVTAKQLEALRKQLRQLDQLRQSGHLTIQWH